MTITTMTIGKYSPKLYDDVKFPYYWYTDTMKYNVSSKDFPFETINEIDPFIIYITDTPEFESEYICLYANTLVTLGYKLIYRIVDPMEDIILGLSLKFQKEKELEDLK